MNYLRITFFITVLVSSNSVFAFHPEDGLDASAILTRFEFTEFDDMQKPAVREYGYLYGGELEAKKSFAPGYIELIGSYQSGTVTYDGKTQSGDNHQTWTREMIQDYAIHIGRIYESWRRYDYGMIYVGGGYHIWQRDIQNNHNITGLFEIYSWPYFAMGARGFLFKLGKVHTLVELNLTKTWNARMDVSFRGKYDNMRVVLGDHFGARLSMPIRVELTRRFQLSIEPYWEAWDLGRSEHIDVTREGFVAGALHEPRSESRYYGVSGGLQMNFD